jgi:hypothetical protein
VKQDLRIVVNTNKSYYSEGEELRINFWINDELEPPVHVKIISPKHKVVSYMKIEYNLQSTETIAFECGGPKMNVNRDYKVRVSCGDAYTDTVFEFYSTNNMKTSRKDWT